MARDAIVKMNVKIVLKCFLLFTEMVPLCFIKVFDVSKNELHRLNYINLTKKNSIVKSNFLIHAENVKIIFVQYV